MTDKTITVLDVALPGEADRYEYLQRRMAWYYLGVMLPMSILTAIRWVGERADAALDWIELPPYRIRNEMHELNRQWHIRARRIREQQSDQISGQHGD